MKKIILPKTYFFTFALLFTFPSFSSNEVAVLMEKLLSLDTFVKKLDKDAVKKDDVGRVGIGTDKPMRALHLLGNQNVEAVLEVQNAKENFKKWNFVVDGGSETTASKFFIRQLNDQGTGGPIRFSISGENGRVNLRGTGGLVINTPPNPDTPDKPNIEGANLIFLNELNNISYNIDYYDNKLRFFIEPHEGKIQMSLTTDGNLAVDNNITAGGNITAKNFPANSDKRLKNNITPLPDALEKILRLNGYYYFWKENPAAKRQVGVIAQEVEAEYPEIVFTGADGMKSVDYSKLTAVLIEAVKTQQLQIEGLKEIVCKEHPQAGVCK